MSNASNCPEEQVQHTGGAAPDTPPKPYSAPRITFVEDMEVVAGTCSKAGIMDCSMIEEIGSS